MPSLLVQIDLRDTRISVDVEQSLPAWDCAQLTAALDIEPNLVSIDVANLVPLDNWPDLTRVFVTYNGEVVTVDGEPIWIVEQA